MLDNELRAEGRYNIAHVNMPPIRAQRQALDPFRAVNRPVGPFIGHFWVQLGVSANVFFDLDIGLRGKWIDDPREVLRARGRNLRQIRRMKRFGVATAQGQCSDPFGIKGLPAH